LLRRTIGIADRQPWARLLNTLGNLRKHQSVSTTFPKKTRNNPD
jgi:hypothetical protein